METTAADGKNYKTRFYNLDAIIAVGYRVNSYPFVFEAKPYKRVGSTKTVMAQEEYARLLLDCNHSRRRRRWENQLALGVRLEDLDREEILRTRQTAIEQRRLSAGTSFERPRPARPFAIGDQCHFGLGLFVPVLEEVTGEVTGEVAGEVTGEVRRLLTALAAGAHRDADPGQAQQPGPEIPPHASRSRDAREGGGRMKESPLAEQIRLYRSENGRTKLGDHGRQAIELPEGARGCVARDALCCAQPARSQPKDRLGAGAAPCPTSRRDVKPSFSSASERERVRRGS